ncbi:MAG: hypothetical protein HXS54_10535 [Theionarchaea archaeon]|nr:hypothetical protein [Theionarchaea archaeon]
MLVKTIEIVSTAKKEGKNAEDMKKDGLLREWDAWNNKKYTWINAELWIDTICESLEKDETNS